MVQCGRVKCNQCQHAFRLSTGALDIIASTSSHRSSDRSQALRYAFGSNLGPKHRIGSSVILSAIPAELLLRARRPIVSVLPCPLTGYFVERHPTVVGARCRSRCRHEYFVSPRHLRYREAGHGPKPRFSGGLGWVGQGADAKLCDAQWVSERMGGLDPVCCRQCL